MKRNVLLHIYQYANLTCGLMLSLFLRLCSKVELSHMRFQWSYTIQTDTVKWFIWNR